MVVKVELRINRNKIHVGVEIGVESSDITPVLGLLLIHVLEMKRVNLLVGDEVGDDVSSEVMVGIGSASS